MKYTPSHLSLWTHPDSYFGETWDEYYVFLGRHRDSDLLTNCNFDIALSNLGALPEFIPPEDSDGEIISREVIQEGHWAVGWVEWIALHESDVEGLRCADKISAKLKCYPVLDEDALTNSEEAEADRIWKRCLDPGERAQWIRDHPETRENLSWGDLRAAIRGDYFYGIASELIY